MHKESYANLKKDSDAIKFYPKGKEPYYKLIISDLKRITNDIRGDLELKETAQLLREIAQNIDDHFHDLEIKEGSKKTAYKSPEEYPFYLNFDELDEELQEQKITDYVDKVELEGDTAIDGATARYQIEAHFPIYF